MKRFEPFIFLIPLAALVLGACSSDNGSGFQAGALGNGGFYFACDDAVSCTPYSEDAAKFPKKVSLSSTFTVRFVPSSTGLNLNVNNTPTQGITIDPIADFVTVGPSGLTAVKEGFATLAARDAGGQVIDYVVVGVVKPDALVVYDGDDTSSGSGNSTPTALQTLVLARGGTKVVKAFAQAGKQDLAGSLQLEWKSSDSSIVQVQSMTNGKATLLAFGEGTATLTATGGTFSQTVPVQVTP